MKLSKILIATTLLLGAGAPIVAASVNAKDMTKVKADTTKDLADIISYGTCSFSYNNIGNFFFSFNLSEQIFTNTGYMNDHLTDGTYTDENNQNINLGEGIEINGKTLQYWVNYVPETISYPRNDGVTTFPLYAGNKFNPVAIEVKTNKLEFKVDLNYIPMDDITVTFKAGVFKGYNNGIIYTLSRNLTYYSVASQNGSPGRVTFVSEKNWQPIRNAYRSISDWGESTASQGGKYHKYLMWTDIPFDKEVIKQACPADNYRYMYNNLLMNGKPIAYYNSWARGNSKDFTNLSDTTTQNPDYELGHPTGSPNTTYDLAVRIEIVRDQPVYAFVFSVPNQLVTDLSLGALSFSLREGASFLTKDVNGDLIIGRISTTEFNNMALSAQNEIENYVDLDIYSETERAQVLDIISEAQAEILSAVTQSQINAIVAEAKAELDAVFPETMTHITEVVALIDAIPSNITYTEECGAAIRAAMEAFANLTQEEVAAFPSDKLDALYAAYAAFSALDLANYKTLSKTEIATVNLTLYRELQQSAITDLQTQANSDIDAATSKAAVQTVVDNFFAELANIPTDEQMTAQELALAKSNAKAQLDAINLDAYRQQERAKVEEVIANGKVAIDQCNSVDEVNTLMNKLMTVIGAIQTADQVAMARRIALQKTTIITSAILGTALLVGAGLAFFLVRRRKLAK